MTFPVCLQAEVLIPVREDTEEYRVVILYLYVYEVTFSLLPHRHGPLVVSFLHKLSNIKYFCWASSPEVQNTHVLWKVNQKLCEHAAQRQQHNAFYWKFWIVHSQPRDKWTVPCILAGKSIPMLFFFFFPFHLWLAHSCQFFWQKTVHAFQALSLKLLTS